MINAQERELPELRFPEFEGEWEGTVLNNLATVVDCKHRTPPYAKSGVPVISPGTIKWGEIDIDSPVKRVSETEYLSFMDHCVPAKGDMVFSRNQCVGVACILFRNEKFVLGQDTVLIQPKRANSFYVYYRIQTYGCQSMIASSEDPWAIALLSAQSSIPSCLACACNLIGAGHLEGIGVPEMGCQKSA